MDPLALTLVIASSILHVGWNAQAKGAQDPLAFLWLALLIPGALGGALLTRAALAGSIDCVALACVIASGAVHCVYFWALGAAYRLSDLSFVYPYSRAIGALLSVVGGVLVFCDRTSAVGMIGIGLTLLATLFELPRSAQERSHWRGALLTALTGAAIAAYQLIDKVGVSRLDTASYLFGLLCASTLFMTPMLLSRGSLRAELARSRARPLFASLFLVSSYGLVLFALARAPLSYVVAARASGIAVGAVAGLVLFHEPVARGRWVAVAMVTVGVYCIGTS
jgi:multidrug transporter EmrE-like cation transporter